MTSRTYAHATGEHREAALAAMEEFVIRAGGVEGQPDRRDAENSSCGLPERERAA